jgi:ornithine decarboxylase
MNGFLLPDKLQKLVEDYLKKKTVSSPVILCSSDLIRDNYKFFLKNLKVDRIAFPVKVNHREEVLSVLKNCNTHFEVASPAELSILKNLKISPDRIFSSNPVRTVEHILALYNSGVRLYAVDRISELERLAKNAAGSKIYIRISVPNAGAAWRLDHKFGASSDEAIGLMAQAKKNGLQPCGIAFHVGWCNTNISSWENAVKRTIKTAEKAIRKKIPIEFINIGGGFPAHNVDQYSELKKISSAILPLLDGARKRLKIQVWAEPGSFICANSSVLVTKVIDVAGRSGKNWVWIDAGVFQGFYWKLGSIKYRVFSLKKKSEKMEHWVVTGPTCDSNDVFSHSAELPATLKSGNNILIFPAGAYIHSAEHYNGFPYPGFLMD